MNERALCVLVTEPEFGHFLGVGLVPSQWPAGLSAKLRAQPDTAEAPPLASEAFTILLQIGRADGIAVVGAELGGWLCAAMQWPRAAQVLQLALAMAQRLDDKPRIEQISAALAQCAQHGVQLEQ